VDYVRLAKSRAKLPVALQTNAIRLDDPALVSALVEAGLDEALVSLHGATAKVSDAITEAPGTFARTVKGIDNLHAVGLRILLNFVICEKNYRALVDYMRLVGERWPRAIVNISFVAASTDVVPRDRDLVPAYSEVLPHLAEALTQAERLGLTIDGFQSMCGIPLCLVPEGMERFFGSLREIPDGFDQGEFVKTDVCRSCALETRCYGIRRGYVELHGPGELKAFP
jgi:MoaA/NifB/PqqE/SkfB family radical SAM enzyme